MESNTNNLTSGREFIGTKPLPDNQSSAVRVRPQKRESLGRRAKEFSCSMERTNLINR